MKTPREVLLNRHRAAEPKLDAMRREVLATAKKDEPGRPTISLREFLRSLRWHLAGLSAVWLFIMFLNLDAGRAPSMVAAIPRAKIPSPQIILASLRENRRQISEMMETNLPVAKPSELFVPRPRSERREEELVA